jgi:molecular chaperone GrpE
MNDDTTQDVHDEEHEIPQTGEPLPDESNSLTEITTLRDQLARSQADYQNLLKRHERDMAGIGLLATSQALLRVLPSVDNLERALEAKKDITDDTWVNGIRSTYEGLIKSLESIGVKAFSSIGSEVDPDHHEVVMQGKGKEGIIITEIEK